MKLLILFVFVLSIIYCGCDKYTDLKSSDDLVDTCRLRGRLFLLDTLTQQALNVPQAGKKILLSYSGSADTINYLYSTTTDSEGYFIFDNLDRNKIYRLVYEEKIADKIYRAEDSTKVPSDSMILLSRLAFDKQPGIYVTVSDGNGQPVPKATVCIFNNATAYGSGKCDNASFQTTTDAYGRGYVVGLQSATYYLLTTASIGGNNYTSRDTVVVDNIIRNVAVDIMPRKPTGVQFTATDEMGNTISGAQMCLFTSRLFFARDTCEASNYSDSTNAEGVVGFTDLPVGKLYVLGSLSLSNVTYRYRDSVVIEEGVVKKLPMMLK